MHLLTEADIKVGGSKRTLLVGAQNFPLEVLYLRDDDIPQSVATGVADIGVVGENEFVERGAEADIVSRLGFLLLDVVPEDVGGDDGHPTLLHLAYLTLPLVNGQS